MIRILIRDEQNAAVALEQTDAEMDAVKHHADFDNPRRIARSDMHVEIFAINDAERLKAAFAVRFTVFVDEQRVPAEEEVDEHDRTDADARHAVIRENGVPVAAGRYYRVGESTAQIGRMAVLASHRGRRLGRALLDALVNDARGRGFTRAALNAQDHAVDFYAKAGFAPYGETLMEADILHQPMDRAL